MTICEKSLLLYLAYYSKICFKIDQYTRGVYFSRAAYSSALKYPIRKFACLSKRQLPTLEATADDEVEFEEDELEAEQAEQA
ncbi:hypothetical protein HA402_006236 [Bradysia odoriphaga]|nr:hypothetical protein HA402_006236 [Bradysia odoriphaga]